MLLRAGNARPSRFRRRTSVFVQRFKTDERRVRDEAGPAMTNLTEERPPPIPGLPPAARVSSGRNIKEAGR